MLEFIANFFDLFERPWLLLLLLLAIPIIWLGRKSLATLEPARRWVAISLRLAVLLFIVLMLTGLQAVQTHSGLTVMAVVDQSESVRRFAQPPTSEREPQPASATAAERWSHQQWLRAYLRDAAQDRRTHDRFGMITYDSRPIVRAMPSASVDLDIGTIEQPGEGSDSATALRSAMALFPPDSGKRVVWISDGNDITSTSGLGRSNQGQISDLIATAYEAAAAGVQIDVVPVRYQVEREVMLDALYAPIQSREGQTVPVRVVLRATQPTTGKLYLTHDEQALNLNTAEDEVGATVSISDWTLEEADETVAQDDDEEVDEAIGFRNARYVAVKQVDLTLDYAGVHRFKAVFEPNDPSTDTIEENNQAEAFTLVSGRSRILLVDNVGGEPGAILPNALRDKDIEIDVITTSALPTQLQQLQRYDGIVFHNVSADLVSPSQQKIIASYVNNLGGGLVKIGGPEGFGAGGWANSEIDKILPVSSEIPSQSVLPSGALMIVIDRSGSMGAYVGGTNRTQQEIANEASVLALGTLYPQDYLGVIAFDTSARTIVQLSQNQNFPEVARRVRSIQPGGGTNIYAGIEAAYRQLIDLEPEKVAIKHVIVLTDGISNGQNYIRLLGNMRRANITVSTVGIGDEIDASLMQQIASMGGGQYHYVADPNNLPQVFIKEAKTIRRNLLKEKEFYPELRVTGSPIMTNIFSVPPLRGLVLTAAKDDPRIFMPMIGEENEPIFAHWQVGLGRVAAFTSDATNRWASQWVGWDGFSDFWARTIRTIARPSATQNVDIVAAVHGDRLDMRLDLADIEHLNLGEHTQHATHGRQSDHASFMNIRATVLRPDGTSEIVLFEQSGPGFYEAQTRAAMAGNYIVELFLTSPDGQTQRVTTGASRIPGDELRHFRTNMRVLEQVAQITGGRVLSPDAENIDGLFARTMEIRTRSVQPLWHYLMLALLPLLLLDVASRRIAWDPAAINAWLQGAGAGTWESIRSGESAAKTTLGALKRHRSTLASQAENSASDTVSSNTSRAHKTKKFEVDESFKAQHDFSKAVGAARQQNKMTIDIEQTSPTHKQHHADDGGPTTSRLLNIKRRTRDDHDSDKKQKD